MVRVELARRNITRKTGTQAVDRLPCSLADSSRSFRFAVFKPSQSGAQALGVQFCNREDANAALRASLAALEPVAGPSRGIGGLRINNLHQVLVAYRQHESRLEQPGRLQRKMKLSSFALVIFVWQSASSLRCKQHSCAKRRRSFAIVEMEPAQDSDTAPGRMGRCSLCGGPG